jgi:two-component system nitrate/nitrite response regulator NarL
LLRRHCGAFIGLPRKFWTISVLQDGFSAVPPRSGTELPDRENDRTSAAKNESPAEASICVPGQEIAMRKRHSSATIIVGKPSLVVDGVARILRSANFHVVASVSCADDLSGKAQPDGPLFLIVHAGTDFDFVLGQIGLLRASYPAGRIAIVADRYQPDELVSAFRAGANGCFAHVMTCDVFVRSLELVMMGETVLPTAFLSYVLGPEQGQLGNGSHGEDDSAAILVTETDTIAQQQLSPREKSILRFLIDGDSNKSIARKMDIAEATVKVHVKAILRKIRVHNRTQAAIWGMNNGWQPRTTCPIAPPLSQGMAKRLPGTMGRSSEIEQNDEPICSTVIDQANHADVPRLNRLIRKDANLRTEAAFANGKRFSVVPGGSRK